MTPRGPEQLPRPLSVSSAGDHDAAFGVRHHLLTHRSQQQAGKPTVAARSHQHHETKVLIIDHR
jgi:hypothetical protein